MDAWSATIRDHTNRTPHCRPRGRQAAGPRQPRSQVHVYGTGRTARFATMLRNVYLPEIHERPREHERQLGAQHDGGRARASRSSWRTGRPTTRPSASSAPAIPAFIYLTTDGALPKTPPGSGHRHAGRDRLLLAQPVHVRRRARPGDLPGLRPHRLRPRGRRRTSPRPRGTRARTSGPEIRERMRHAWGLHTKYQNGAPVPSWLCGGSSPVKPRPGRRGRVQRARTPGSASHGEHPALHRVAAPHGTNNLFIAWETLTHAANPA